MRIVQAQLLEQYETGQNRDLGRDHHAGQKEDEYKVFPGETHFGKGVGRPGGYDQLSEDREKGDLERIEIHQPEGHGRIRPDIDVILHHGRDGDPPDRVIEDLVVWLEGSGDHPYQRQYEDQAESADDHGGDYLAGQFFLFHGYIPPLSVIKQLFVI